MDDLYKDYAEGNSPVIRDAVWDWYTSVVRTRLHNDSQELIVFTRWHEDDLAGRLLNPDINKDWQKWKVIKFDAICDEKKEFDPREIGEALWPERHNLGKLNSFRAMSENIFQAMYQQNPVARGGNKIKRDWFTFVDDIPGGLTANVWVDGAYTKNTKNDPTGIMITAFDDFKQVLYVKYAYEKYLEMPDLLKEMPVILNNHGVGFGSVTYIEPKASGKSLGQMLNARTNIPAVEINNYLVNEGKESRLNIAAPYIESGKVRLLKGSWNDKLINQLVSFPKAKHDEFVDLLGYACFHHFKPGKNIYYDNPVGLDNLI
jgi:predicted phage terminase large subunit-like protein